MDKVATKEQMELPEKLGLSVVEVPQVLEAQVEKVVQKEKKGAQDRKEIQVILEKKEAAYGVKSILVLSLIHISEPTRPY